MPFLDLFSNLSIKDLVISAIEIIILTIIFYRLILIVKGSRAESVTKTLVILIAIFFLAKYAGFKTISWLLEKILLLSFFAIPIVFQPEIRRGLEKIGRSFLWTREFEVLGEQEKEKVISIISEVAYSLAANRIGALIVIEKNMKIDGFVEGGIVVDARMTPETLSAMFTPHGPLHDGAVVIRGDKIYLARCFLPLTDNPNVSAGLGSRHRAALGLSELTDSLIIAVSEENQEVSIVHMGRITKISDKKTFFDLVLTLSSTSFAYREKER